MPYITFAQLLPRFCTNCNHFLTCVFLVKACILHIECTSDIVASPGATTFWPLYLIGHYIRPEYNRINVFCTRKSGQYIRMPTINMVTISGVHCILNCCARGDLSCWFSYRGQSESHFGKSRRCMSQGI